MIYNRYNPQKLSEVLLFEERGNDWVSSTGFAVLRCRSSKAIPEFLIYHLFSNDINKQINTLISGSNYPAISSGDIKKIKIPVPSIDEQIIIGHILGNMDKELKALKSKLKKTKSIKQGMMQELLTGKTRLIESG